MKKILFSFIVLYNAAWQSNAQGIPQLQAGVFVYDTLGSFVFTFSGLCPTPEYILYMDSNITPFATGVNLHLICTDYTPPAGAVWTDEAGTLSLYDSLFFSNLTPCFHFSANASGSVTFLFMIKGTPTVPNEPYPCYFNAVYTPAICNNNLFYSGDTATCYVEGGPTGWDEQEHHSRIKIFPNPLSTEATVEVTGEESAGVLQMVLTDVLGRMVRRVQLPSSGGKLMRGSLASGIYYYSIIGAGMTIGSGKIVIE